MKSKEIWMVIAIALVVSVIGSFAAVNLTGGAITGNAVSDTLYNVKNRAGYILGSLTSSSGTDSVILQKTNGKGDLIIQVKNPTNKNNISFQQNGKEVMRIDSNGKVILPLNIDGTSLGYTGLGPEGFFQEVNEHGQLSSISLAGDNLIMDKESSGSKSKTILSPGSLSPSDNYGSSRLTSSYIQFCDANYICIYCYPDFVNKALKCRT